MMPLCHLKGLFWVSDKVCVYFDGNFKWHLKTLNKVLREIEWCSSKIGWCSFRIGWEGLNSISVYIHDINYTRVSNISTVFTMTSLQFLLIWRHVDFPHGTFLVALWLNQEKGCVYCKVTNYDLLGINRRLKHC